MGCWQLNNIRTKVIIIGAGPAGLTAAYELVKRGYSVKVFEESNIIGGISKTVNYKGNLMDMGGHRFFSKAPEVNEWWDMMMPMQGSPSKDDILLKRNIPLSQGGPDPEKTDVVMLTRRRVSRIYFDGKFYDYPISLKLDTFRNMGFKNTIKCGTSYIASVCHKLPESNLENFYINSFGKQLYSKFFENYTENLWGRHPREIDASWGAQRTKGLSVAGVLKNVLVKALHRKNRNINTSLIEQFKYPKLGPGELWKVTASKVEELGGIIEKESKVTRIHKRGQNIVGITYERAGKECYEEGDIIISSMPLKDLVTGMNDVPAEISKIAGGLPYRDYITLGVLVKEIALKNTTNISTINDIVPDCWVYVQDKSVKMGRFQIYNNWSPYMVKDIENTVWVGLEYFCNEGDAFWNQNESELAKQAVSEMIRIGLITDETMVLDYHMERVKKAYPAYFDTYSEIDTLIDYLNTIENLYCVGRNGQHKYNNLDHSMMTSFEAVKCITSGNKDKSTIWKVNTEKEYHEAKT